MKILLYIVMGILAAGALLLFTGYRYISKATGGGYKSYNDKVYYIGKMQGLGSRKSTELKQVDLLTFKALRNGYAKDAHRAYFLGIPVLKSHAPSFKPMKYHFAKDRDWVYYQGQAISQLPEDFKVMSREYGRDQLYAYYRGEVVQGSKGSRFRLLRHGYAKDTEHVYFNGKILTKDVANFKMLKYENGNAFAKDSEQVYINGSVMKNKDPRTYQP